jgi:hypothetical protein
MIDVYERLAKQVLTTLLAKGLLSGWRRIPRSDTY